VIRDPPSSTWLRRDRSVIGDFCHGVCLFEERPRKSALTNDSFAHLPAPSPLPSRRCRACRSSHSLHSALTVCRGRVGDVAEQEKKLGHDALRRDCRAAARGSKPCLLKKSHNSAPEKTRSLGMRYFELFDGNFAFVQPPTNLRFVGALQPKFDCFLNHLFRVLRRFTLTHDAEFGAARHIIRLLQARSRR
jgi:hypothetical protein